MYIYRGHAVMAALVHISEKPGGLVTDTLAIAAYLDVRDSR